MNKKLYIYQKKKSEKYEKKNHKFMRNIFVRKKSNISKKNKKNTIKKSH